MLLLLAFSVFVGAAKLPATDFSTNIIGGDVAGKGEFPYIVSLREYESHICGGSILDSRHILTAAHCVVDSDPEDLSIQYGTNRISEDSRNSIDVIHIATCSFDPDTSIDDLAVLTLRGRGIPLGRGASAVALPPQGQPAPGNAMAVLAGWGLLEPADDDSSPEYLQKIDLKIYTERDCQTATEFFEVSPDPRYQICAGTDDNETGACLGDSGGPLTVDGVQYGIVSFGTQSCADGSPTVYTKVSNYVGWIKNQMRE